MNTMPEWLLPTDTALTFSLDTSTGRVALDESTTTLTLARPWYGPDPISAFSSWLNDTGATGIRLDADAGTVTWATDPASPLSAAHRAHLVAWWLTQVSAGIDQWAAFGSMASVWSSVRIPSMDGVGFKHDVGLIGWKGAGAHTAILFLRPLHAATPMPLLRVVIDGSDAAPADRLACRFSPTMRPDAALDQAVGFDSHRKSFVLPEGSGPADVAHGVQRVEWLATNAAALAALRDESTPTPAPVTATGTPFEAIGTSPGAPAAGPAASEPMVHSPAIATVIPRSAAAPDHTAQPPAEPTAPVEPEGAADPTTDQNDSTVSDQQEAAHDDQEPPADTVSDPLAALQFERPRVEVPVPETTPSLPEADSKALFDLFLQHPSSNHARTVELLTRVLKMSAEDAAAACESAPVKIAGRIAAWEVRKLDAVIRLGGGGTLHWVEVEPG